MDKKKIPKKSGEISRREFLKDAGLVVGGAAIGSTVLLAACAPEEVVTTETVTETATQTQTQTATTTQTATQTATVTETVSKFICPSCGGEFATLAALQAHFEAEHPAEVVPEKLTKLIVNGVMHELKVEPEWTLHDVIHRELGLIGAKTFCDRGACGSCTVIVDGRPILSCVTLAIECDSKTIETVEGIAKAKHPLIEAYVENHCMQCGYCTPGFVVTAKALLDRNPNPTADEAIDAIAGNLCRCGTYPQHAKAILQAAEELGVGG